MDAKDKLEKLDKGELISAARIALADPVADDFWADVASQLDKSETKVEPRRKS